MSNTSNWKQIHGFPAYWVSDNGEWGEGHNMAKLKEAEVKEIRRLYSTGLWTQFQLADSFGVGHSNISAITTRRSWRHI